MSYSPSHREHFRKVLAQYPTGVAVITGSTDGGPAGFAVGSFGSISLDPRMVGFYVDHSSTSWPPIRETGNFCVNVLAADQTEICRTFASSGGDKFAGIEWHPAPSGSPIIDDALAWIDCGLERETEIGDHWLVVGDVIDLDANVDKAPLVFHRGAYPELDVT